MTKKEWTKKVLSNVKSQAQQNAAGEKQKKVSK